MPRGVAWILLIVGLLMGTVCTVDLAYWSVPIEASEARQVTATFESYTMPNSKDATVYFSDREPLTIDELCTSDRVESRLRALTEGAKVQLLLHPNSDTILAMQSEEGLTVLDFDDAQEALRSGNKGWLVFAIVMHTLAVWGLCGLIADIVRNRKKN